MGWIAVLLWPVGGYAAEPGCGALVLPSTETRDAWRVPAELAGLGLDAARPGCTAVRVEAGPDGWVLRATGADGTVRTARVDPPRTGPQREDVAFLARSLARTMDAGGAPAPLPTRPLPLPLPLPLPPPPPRQVAATPVPEPVPAPIPESEVVPEVVAATEPPPPPAPEARWETVLITADQTEPVGWTLEDLDGPSPSPRRRGRLHGRIEVPPVRLSTPAVYRPGTVPGFAPALGVDFARVAATTVGYELGWCPLRSLGLPLQRQYGSVDLMFRVTTNLGSVVSVGPIAGVSYRFFRQQRTPVATGLTPVVGAELGLVAATAGRWSLAVENRGTVDLTPTRFVLEDQSVHRLSPLALQTGLVVRFAGSTER